VKFVAVDKWAMREKIIIKRFSSPTIVSLEKIVQIMKESEMQKTSVCL